MNRTASPTAGATPFGGSSEAPTRGNRDGFAWARRVASEPLVHFALLGALVFAGHRLATAPSQAPSIEVSAKKQRELSALFEQRQRRAPNEAERKQLVERYVEDEVLFREGLRLSLIHTDPALRGQLIARVRSLVQAEHEQKPPTNDDLQRYYAAHRSDFSIPETIGYREYWIQRGPAAGADAQRIRQALAADRKLDEGLPAPSEYSGRSEAQLVALYDEEVGRALWKLPNDGWHELRSERGIHIVRVQTRTPASDPPLAEIRDQVSTAYSNDQAARALQAEVNRLTSGWHVRVAEAP